MRILFLGQRGFNPRNALFGGSSSILAIYRQLTKQGHSPIIVAPSDTDKEESFEGGKIYYIRDTFETKAFYKNPLLLASKFVQNFNSIFKLQKIIQKEKPDIIMFQPSFLALLSLFLKPITSKSKFVFRHEDLIFSLSRVKNAGVINRILAAGLEWFLCFFSDKVLTTQQSQKEKLLEQYGLFGLTPSKITVVPYVVDMKYLSAKARAIKEKHEGQYKFMYLGGMGYRQDIPGFLSLILPVLRKRTDLKFIFVGKELDNKFSSYIKQNDLKNIEIKPPVKYSELPSLANRADFGLVILKNDKELKYSIPSKFIECMALGKPVFAYGPAGGELESVIKENDVGIFLKSASDIEQEINRLIKNRRKFSLNCRRAITESKTFKSADVFVNSCEVLLEYFNK